VNRWNEVPRGFGKIFDTHLPLAAEMPTFKNLVYPLVQNGKMGDNANNPIALTISRPLCDAQ
jgi:hypothetical protein